MARKRTRQTASPGSAREAALRGRPHAVPPEKTETKGEKLYVTIVYQRPRWQRFLGADTEGERTFGLDPYGQRVYALCDGTRTVRQIIKAFAAATHVSQPEAEMAVTKFLRTLMMKGLVVMAMDKPGEKART